MSQPEIMTAEQVADFLQVDVSHIHRLARTHKIPGAFKVGYLWRFNRNEVTDAKAWTDLSSSAKEETL